MENIWTKSVTVELDNRCKVSVFIQTKSNFVPFQKLPSGKHHLRLRIHHNSSNNRVQNQMWTIKIEFVCNSNCVLRSYEFPIYWHLYENAEIVLLLIFTSQYRVHWDDYSGFECICSNTDVNTVNDLLSSDFLVLFNDSYSLWWNRNAWVFRVVQYTGTVTVLYGKKKKNRLEFKWSPLNFRSKYSVALCLIDWRFIIY